MTGRPRPRIHSAASAFPGRWRPLWSPPSRASCSCCWTSAAAASGHSYSAYAAAAVAAATAEGSARPRILEAVAIGVAAWRRPSGCQQTAAVEAAAAGRPSELPPLLLPRSRFGWPTTGWLWRFPTRRPAQGPSPSDAPCAPCALSPAAPAPVSPLRPGSLPTTWRRSKRSGDYHWTQQQWPSSNFCWPEKNAKELMRLLSREGSDSLLLVPWQKRSSH